MSERNWILEKIAAPGSALCFCDAHRQWRYHELHSQTNAWLTRLEELSITPGTSLIIIGNYSLDAVACLLAAFIKGCIVTPLTLSAKEDLHSITTLVNATWVVDFSGSDCHIEGIIAEHHHPLLERLRQSHHAGLILLSSGSTGTPKAMVLNVDKLIDKYRSAKPRPNAVLLFLLFDHIGGINTLLHTLLNGGMLVACMSRTPQEVLQLIERYRIQVLPYASNLTRH